MKLKISNQQVEIIEPLVLVADTENVYECEYVFDEEWDGFNKTAVFEGCGNTYQVVLTNTLKCKIPNEVIADSGYARFGVLGTKVVGSITQRYPTVWSERVWVDVASVGTGTPQPPTAEVYAQILANEGAIEDRLDDAEDAIEALDGRLDTAESDIDALESGKVDKVEGMGLSHNDYSDNEKLKVDSSYLAKHTHDNMSILNAISQTLINAWNNSVTWIATNGSNILAHLSNTTVHTTANEKSVWNAKQNHLTAGENITIVNDVISSSGGGVSDFEQLTNRPKYAGNTMDKNTNIPSVPSKTSDLTNDSGFLTEHQSLANYYTKSETDTEISSHHDSSKADATSVYTKSEIDTTVSTLQPKTDNLLSTTSKNIVGAINEVDSIALGANQALGVANYQTLVTMMNGATASAYRVGQNIYVQTLNVPDVWVYSVESSSVPYTYTTDEALATALDSGAVQMGYYKISKLEGQKVDLTNYVKFTDYATALVGGVIKTTSVFATETNVDGHLRASNLSKAQYDTLSNFGIISKGTLENVITGKGLVSKTDWATSSVGGVIKCSMGYGATVSASGYLLGASKTYAQYGDASNYCFIDKETLENVLDNESLRIDKSQTLSSAQKSQAYSNLGAVSSQGIPIATSISSSSSNDEIPSAKAVYDFVMSLMG